MADKWLNIILHINSIISKSNQFYNILLNMKCITLIVKCVLYVHEMILSCLFCWHCAFVLSWKLHRSSTPVGSAFFVPLRHLSNPSQYPSSSTKMSASMLLSPKWQRNQPGVCMKTQARWLMLLPLPALMALIFSSAERSQGLRCQMLFCSPPFTGFSRSAARERFTSCFIRRAWWIHSFEEVDTAKRVWSSILFPPSIAVKY